LTALVASGLPASEFHFVGFLPERAGARRTRIEALAAESARAENPRTVVFYEAPHRILDTLCDVEAVVGPETRVVIARELTKVHEEFFRATVAEARREFAGRDRIRGEIVLLVELSKSQNADSSKAGQSERESISAAVARLQTELDIDEKEALKRLARETGHSKSDLYRELQRERARLKAGPR
jgi:16S rRNA (cytidine1402-2'-O)-methyltransferase